MNPVAESATASVVIPLYNKKPFIGQAIRSALGQSTPPIEVLIVDDGSVDGGRELVEELAASAGGERIRLVAQANAGVSAARNRGIAEARGEFVAFLDADDWWAPGFLDGALAALAANPDSGAAFGAVTEHSSRGERSLMPAYDKPVVIADYPAWFMRHRGHGLWSSNTVARRSLVLRCGGFPLGLQNGEDTDTWFRLSFQAPVVYAPAALAYYRIEDEDSLSKRFKAVEPRVIQTLQEALAAGTVPPAARRSARRAGSYFRSAYATALAQDGRQREAIAQLLATRPGRACARAYLRALAALVLGR